MGQRANVLADELESANRDLVAYCESLSDDDWQTVVPNEERTVGVLFQHIAVAYTAETALLRAIIAGQPLPAIYTDRALLDDVNARDAVDLLPGTKAETLQSLDRHARRASRFIRSLSDDDLAASATVGIFGERVWTVEALIEQIVLGHPQIHLASIRAALDRP
jgi:hypothetical protein